RTMTRTVGGHCPGFWHQSPDSQALFGGHCPRTDRGHCPGVSPTFFDAYSSSRTEGQSFSHASPRAFCCPSVRVWFGVSKHSSMTSWVTSRARSLPPLTLALLPGSATPYSRARSANSLCVLGKPLTWI